MLIDIGSMPRVKIDVCPKAGEGVNTWVNLHVLRMLRAGYKDATIYKILVHHAVGCGRDVRSDITHSIETGRLYLGIGKGYGVLKRDYQYDEIHSLKDLPPLDPKFRDEILEKNKIADTVPKRRYNSMEVLWDLFGPNRICIGYNKYHAIITNLVKRGAIIEFKDKIKPGLCQFIVPSPMVGEYALNKAGKRAIRCLANTCQRWFLVVEFDHQSSLEDQIFKLHYELAKEYNLRMLVSSGNKSIHGWYFVYRQPEKEVKNLMKKATRMGADPMTWIRCQYVRFPGGINEKTKERQEIIYYNYGK